MATFTGTATSDGINGGAGDDQISALGGNDVVNGNGGSDIIDGGDGDDQLRGGFSNSSNPPSGEIDGADTLIGGGGNDTLRGQDGNDQLFGGSGDDNLRGDAGDDLLDGGEGSDFAAYRFDDIGAVAGVTFDASLIGTAPTVSFADGRGGIDTLTSIERVIVTGTTFDDTITTSVGADQITTVGGNDLVNAGAGDDVIIDNNGSSTLNGGDGDDRFDIVAAGYFGGAGAGSDTLDGGGGDDVVQLLWGAVSSNVIVNLSAGSLTASTADGALAVTGTGIERVAVFSGSGNDSLTGGSANDLLSGGAGNDLINGGAGDDQLEGGAGDDTLDGGDGVDRYLLRLADQFAAGTVDASGVNIAGGVSTVSDGQGGTDTISNIEGVALSGGNFDDTLIGSAGGDILNGGFGGDTINGGDGDDLIIQDTLGINFPTQPGVGQIAVSESADAINGGAGFDTVSYANVSTDMEVNLALGTVTNASTGNDTLTGIEGVITGSGADLIIGNGADNRLEGGTGNDALFGNNGNDILIGGDGDDSLNGDGGRTTGVVGGADILDGGAGNDTLRGGAGVDQFIGGDGIDSVTFFNERATQGVIADLRNQTISNDGFGNAETMTGIEWLGGGSHWADVQYGNEGDNRLFADAGDSAQGFGGNDEVVTGGAPALLDGGEGTDTIELAFSRIFDINGDGIGEVQNRTAGATIDLSTGQIVADGWGGSGNLISFENINASEFDDTLTGDDGANLFNGRGGDDVLNGGGGNDTLNGDGGNDVLDGGTGDDVLNGGAGDDYLVGGAGNDTIDGGAGANDIAAFVLPSGTTGTYRVVEGTGANAGSLIVERVDGEVVETVFIVTINSGQATVQGVGLAAHLGTEVVTNVEDLHFLLEGPFDPSRFVSINLSTNQFGDFVSGSAGADTINLADYPGAINADGGYGDDDITGTGVNNDLSGGGGDDVLNGGAGSDYIRGGNGNDLVYAGDEVGNFGDGVDGGAGDDVIHGGGSNDTLAGGDGGDTIYGGDGNDTISGSGAGLSVFSGFSLGQPVRSFGITDSGRDDGQIDALFGGAGDDSIFVSVGDTADGGEGTDRLITDLTSRNSGVTLDLTSDAQTVLGNLLGGSFTNFETFAVVGTAFADSLSGSAGNDSLDGEAGDDTVNGGDGADTLQGGLGADIINGGAGNDSIVAGRYNHSVLIGGVSGRRLDDGAVDMVSGGDGDDTATLGFGDNFDGGTGIDRVIVSLAGRTSGVILDLTTDAVARLASAANATYANVEFLSNTLGLTEFDDVLTWTGITGGNTSGSGNLYGGGGDDRITSDVGSQFVGGNEGDDYLDTGIGNDRLWGGSGADTLLGGDGVDILYGDEDNDNALNGVLPSGNDVLNGGAGNDELWGGGGSDHLMGGDGNDLIRGDAHTYAVNSGRTDLAAFVIEGHDVIDGGLGDDTIYGDGGDDLLAGGSGNDQLYGGAGNDLLDGGAGGDVMAGGAGDDVYIIDQAGGPGQVGDGVIEAAGEGVDEIRTTIDWGLGGIPNVENLTALGTANIFLGGNDGANVLTGNAGNNYIVGEGGDDTIDGGGNVADGANSGKDIASYQLAAGTAGTLRLVEGTGADAGKLLVQLVNGGSVQTFLKITLTGQGGAIVEGVGIGAYLGVDTVTNIEELHVFIRTSDGSPAPSSQFLAVNLAPNQFGQFLSGSEGSDTINLADYPGAINANGNRGDDVITGSSANNGLQGSAGNDSLGGLGGDDNLNGGEGDDVLQGGADNDYMIGGAGNDTIDGGGGVNDIAAFNLPAGTTGSYRVVDGTGANTGKLIVERVDGAVVETVFIVTLDGNQAAVQGVGLAAYLGTDTVTNVDELHFLPEGPFNSATFVAINLSSKQFGNFIQGSEASDTINLADYPGAINANGNRGNDTITGTADVNSLQGGAGDDSLSGLGGDDFLNGQNGADTLFGGIGNDTLVGAAGGDTVNGGDGDDILIGAFNTGFGPQPGDGADILRGDGGNDIIRGGDGDDLLEGGDGSDNLRGDAGSDTLDGGAGEDFASYFFSALNSGITFDARTVGATAISTIADPLGGVDTLISIEKLGIGGTESDDILYGSAHLNPTVGYANQMSGNGGNDQLYGGIGNDFLDGGTGGDVMSGGAGDDVYFVDKAGGPGVIGDGVIEAAGEGVDEIRTTIDWGLGGIPDVENLTALGTANIFLGGNDSANVLTGNSGNNYIVGEGGNDTIDGGGNVPDGADSGKDIASYQLAAGTVGTLMLVEGTGADAGKLLAQLVNGGSVETFLKITLTAEGGAIVEGVGVGAYMGTDTVTNIEDLHIFIRTADGSPTPSNQFLSVNLAPNQYGNFLAGSEGADTINLADYPGAINANGNRGNDTVTGTDANNGLQGGAGNDSLGGLGGDDNLNGDAGDDVLQGGADNDYMIGGAGNDTIDGGAGVNDIAAFNLPAGTNGSYRVIDGTGANAGKLIVERVEGSVVETVFIVTINGSQATVQGVGIAAHLGTDIVTNVDELHFLPEGPFDASRFAVINLSVRQFGSFVRGSEAADTIDLADYAGGLNVNGTRGDDVITGNGSSNNLSGGLGDDVLNGLGGNDYLIGEGGNDVIDGGGNVPDGVNSGKDIASYQLAAGTVGTLILVDGTGADAGKLLAQLVNGALVQTFLKITPNGQGGGTVEGVGIGADMGSDTVINVEELHIFVRTTDGSPTAPGQFLAVNFAANQFGTFVAGSEGADTIDLANYAGSINANGNRGDDVILGTAANNGLNGGAGNDILSGLGGADTLTGGAGGDTLTGGDGDDVLIGAFNTAFGPQPGDGADILRGDGGNDVIRGGDGDDLLEGGDGNDNLRGDAGSDTLDGGAGEDFASYFFTLNSGVTFDARAVGAGPISTVVDPHGGVDTLISIEKLGIGGTEFDDVLYGSEHFAPVVGFANQMSGNGGNDQLYGGSGNDLLDGGLGADTLVGGGGGDALLGGGGNDTLTGGDGDDFLVGGDGNDQYNGGAGTLDRGVFYIDGATPATFSVQTGTGVDAGKLLVIRTDGAVAEIIAEVTSVGASIVVKGVNSAAYLGTDTLTGVERLVFSTLPSNPLETPTMPGFAVIDIGVIAGTVADGYVAGATVFVDNNRNGVLDAGEASALTDANGHFSLVSFGGGPIVAVGGVNTDTGLPNTVALSAPTGSTVINPLTTLVQAVSTASGISAAAAQEQVKAALGLDPNLSLLTTDLLAGAAAGTPGTLDAQKAAAIIVTMLEAATDAAGGASGAEAAALAQIASIITDAPTGGVDLTDSSLIEDVLEAAAPAAGDLSAAAAALSTTTSAIANAASLEDLSSKQAEAMLTGNELANELVSGARGDVLTGAGGNDVLRGNGGDDTLYGGAGDDTLIGGDGFDRLYGGEGRDRFVIEGGTTVSGSYGNLAYDVIFDFNSTDDFIDFGASTLVDVRRYGNVNDAEKSLGVELDGLGKQAQPKQFVTVAFGDSNGDGVADFAVALIGAKGVEADDIRFGATSPTGLLRTASSTTQFGLASKVAEDTFIPLPRGEMPVASWFDQEIEFIGHHPWDREFGAGADDRWMLTLPSSLGEAADDIWFKNPDPASDPWG